MSQKLSPLAEKKVKEIADYLFRRDYPSALLMDIFDTFGGDKTTCEALSVLITGKLIRLDDHLGKKATLMSIQTLDQNGQDIKHEMCDTYPNSDTFGNWFTETFRASDTCFEEHNKEGLWNHNCEKCKKEKASWICVSHGQSMLNCQGCKETTKKYNKFIQDNKMEIEEFIKVLMDEHKKDLLRRKSLDPIKPKYETMIKERKK